MDWKRVKTACEWGLLFGVLSWLLATGITNKIPVSGIWAIIISRTLMGFIIATVRWEFPWWARGLIIGFGINIIMVLIVQLPLGQWLIDLGFGWIRGFWMMMITGLIFGVLNEWILVHREKVEASAKSEA